MTDTPVHPEFGDYTSDDALDTAPADPLQVAMRIHRYRRYLSQLAGDDIGDFFEMGRREQDEAVALATEIVGWIETHDPSERADLAEEINNVSASSTDWDDLPDDERDVAEAIAKALSEWLIRQGAWS